MFSKCYIFQLTDCLEDRGERIRTSSPMKKIVRGMIPVTLLIPPISIRNWDGKLSLRYEEGITKRVIWYQSNQWRIDVVTNGDIFDVLQRNVFVDKDTV